MIITNKRRPVGTGKYAAGGLTGFALAVIAGIWIIASAAVAAGQGLDRGFVAGFEDLPLAPGVENVPGSETVFDSGRGRIIDATAVGRATAAAVRDFYLRSLPQLGWSALTEGRFRREAETLTIGVTERDGEVVVRFTLAPAPGGP